MTTLITFAIAAYNAEPYIAQCINSILPQCGNDCEIVITDDGSTDATGKICDSFAEKDPRIRVIHTKNRGVSAARNLIIQNARGKWISFVDADDMLCRNAVEQIRKYSECRHEIVYFDAMFFRKTNERIGGYAGKKEIIELTGKDIFPLMLSTIYYTNEERHRYGVKTIYSIWGKMIRMDFLRKNKLFLNEALKKSEDMEFNFRCLKYVSAVLLVPCAFYLHRNNSNSVTKNFIPAIPEYNSMTHNAFIEDITVFEGPEYDKLSERCVLLGIIFIIVDMEQSIFHRANPADSARREAAFYSLISRDRSKYCIDHCNTALLAPHHKALYEIIKTKNFTAAEKYFRREQLAESVKAAMSGTPFSAAYKTARAFCIRMFRR